VRKFVTRVKLPTPDTHRAPAPDSKVVRVWRIDDAAGWDRARALILEYLAWASAQTGLDPCDVQPWLPDELAHLDEWYTPPRGVLLQVALNGVVRGIVGLALHDGGWAEM
jgi:hypothetical protein